jgi:hypothetical protein
MFNTPILDIAIGLSFVFASYSLLATSVKEGIATLLGLRARMLRKGIITGMLTATPDYTHWYSYLESLVTGIGQFLGKALASMVLIRPWRSKDKNTIGGKFYQHPILKNYGSSGLYPYPSYLPAKNFSLILVDVMKSDFFAKFTNPADIPNQDIQRINTLLQQYRIYHNNDQLRMAAYKAAIRKLKKGSQLPEPPVPTQSIVTEGNCLIDEETLSILELHLRESLYNMDDFKGRLEDWFDDSMNRVSGWYKRQVQVILFFIGICMGIIFNVDTINIASRLSKDDKLRDQVVQSAVAYSQVHKDQVNQRPTDGINSPVYGDSIDKRLNEADSYVKHDIHDINSLMSIGYGDYGEKDPVFLEGLKHKNWWVGMGYLGKKTSVEFDMVRTQVADSIKKANLVAWGKDPTQFDSVILSVSNARFFQKEMREHPLHTRKAYIWYATWSTKHKVLSFLVLAFAVCLGAPFWFDMLSKLINLRATGKKEDGDGTGTPTVNSSVAAAPVQITLNPQNGQEAVG